MNNEFWNAVQAASNSVAGNVAGPVDILGFLLRKAGVPVPENALLSSKWMEEQGLMKPVRQGVGQVIGDTVGLLAPTMIAAKAPQIAAAAIKGGENLAAPTAGMAQGQRGAIVYHGSPHKFDKFDSSKIGTGEGAQAYGHGLYVADKPEVAMEYADKLSQVALDGGGYDKVPRFATYGKNAPRRVDLNAPSNTLSPAELALTYVNMNKGSKFEAGEALKDMAASGVPDAAKYKDALRALDRLSYKKIGAEEGGNLYKVDLPDEKIAKMLDWDKPLSEQAPEVQQFFKKYVDPIKKVEAGTSGPEWGELAKSRTYDPAGGELVRLLAGVNNSLDASTVLSGGTGGAATSRRLMEAGIPGIRYLDGGSRSAGAGSSNYVIFPGNEGILKILERNGQGLLDPPVTPALLNQGKRGQRGAFVFPGEERLLTAQKNAAKPISEGGLGLRADNTAAERAKALGFDREVFHGTNKDIQQFSANGGAKTGNPNASLGTFASPNPAEASRYTVDFGPAEGGNVMPLLYQSADAYKMPYKEFDDMAMAPYRMMMSDPSYNPHAKVHFGDIEGQRAAAARLAKYSDLAAQKSAERGKELLKEGYKSAVVSEGRAGEEVIALNPSVFRSRFAAFDPARVNESDLLGGADPYLLALLGLGTGGAAYFGGGR